MAVQAGPKRHRGKIYASTTSQDQYGQPIESFPSTPTAERWLEIRYLSGNELIQAQAVNAHVTAEIKMRHYDLKPYDKVVIRDIDWYVVTVSNSAELDVETIAQVKRRVD